MGLPPRMLVMRSLARGMAIAVLLLGPFPVHAQSDLAPRLVLECAPCHGFDGIGHDDSIPNLAGQHLDYLTRQLLAFRSGTRRHPEMNFFSRQLPQDELTAIIRYFSDLPRP
jgi:cytochrome c553